MKTSVRLARLLSRSRRHSWTFIPLFVGVALGVVTLLGLRAAELSPTQAATAAFGSADGSTALTEQIRPGERAPDLPDVGQQSVTTQLTAFVSWRLPEGDLWNGVYVEEELPSVAQEGRITLRSGRWPAGPDELAVTAAAPFTLGQTLTSSPEGLGGVVVGVVDLPLGHAPQQVLAAPGRWAAWDGGAEVADVAGLAGQMTYFWTASGADQVAAELDVLREEGAPLQKSGTATQTIENAAAISAKDLLERDLPGALVILLGALSTGALLARFHRRNLTPMRSVGVPMATLRVTTALAASIGAVTAVLLGLATGLLLTLGARGAVASRSARELRPWEWGSPPLALALICAPVVVVLVAVGVAAARPRRQPARRLPELSRGIVVGVLLGCTLVSTVLASSPLPSFWVLLGIVVCVALMAACLAVTVVDRGKDPTLGPRLAARRLIRSRRRDLGAVTGLLAASVTVLAATLAIAGGSFAHLNRVSGTGYPPGLALFTSPGLSVTSAEQAQADFEQYVGLQPDNGVTVDYGLLEGNGETVPGWVFSSSEEVEQVFGSLSPEQQEVLADGALTPEVTEKPEPDELAVSWDLRWLRAVALEGRVNPVDTQVATLYPGLTSEQDRLAHGWAEARGFGPGLVQATEQAPDLSIPWQTQGAVAGLGAVIVVVVLLAMRGEMAAYRDLLGTFAAIGLGRPWITRVGATVGGRIGASAGLTALVGTGFAVLLAQRALRGSLSVTGIPWVAVIALCTSVIVGAGVGGALAARTATGRDRTG